MSKVRRIAVLEEQSTLGLFLRANGYGQAQGLEVIELTQLETLLDELKRDGSIVAAVVPDLADLMAIRTSECGQRLPVVVHGRHYRYELFRWDDVTLQTLVGEGHELLRGLNELLHV